MLIDRENVVLSFRRILPLLSELCAGDLFGYRVSVPCSPEDYLNNEYGIHQWQYPTEHNYTWPNMRYHSVWNDLSWMYAVRLYTPDGELRTDEFAVDWISKSFAYSFQSIPSFLNVIPNRTVTLPPMKNSSSTIPKRKAH